jgi:endogenous inhibitor of DNA gyrase (YacG/DUF329 family)
MSEPSSAIDQPGCPICGKPLDVAKPRFAPFCSRRCADLDLGRWLKGSYMIPASPEEAEAPDPGSDQVPDGQEK